jgi:predicted PurR-regulated permease PerM
MNSKVKDFILYGGIFFTGSYFLFAGLIKGSGFFIPLTLAIILSMLMLPVAKKFESWGLGRGWSVLFSDLIILGFVIGLFFLLSYQVNTIVEDWPQLKKQIVPKIEQVQSWIERTTGFTEAQQEQKIQEAFPFGNSEGSGNQQQDEESGSGEKTGKSGNSGAGDATGTASGGNTGNSGSSGGSGLGKNVANLLTGFLGILGNFLLVLVYIFFFMFYRSKFKKSLLKMAPDNKRDKMMKVIEQSSRVSQQYLLGRFILIMILAVLYSLGFSLLGVKYAIFVAFIAAVFTLIPYIGNIIGLTLALVFSFLDGGGIGKLLGLVGLFTVIQFIESYILEPYIVGHKVDLNPVFTIIAVVVGGAIWGIAGMIIAIPVLGIMKVIFDHLEGLKPVGYMLGEEDIDSGDNFFNKAERWFMKKLGKSN